MKVLGIVCSPRLHGNTEIMVREALTKAEEEGAETELITLAGKRISPCDGCESCRKTKKCHTKDDMQDIYTKLLDADGIIFGTPVYYWNVTAQAKALMDRTYLLSKDQKLLEGKVAAAVAVGERRGTTNTIAAFSGYFNLQRMVMVGSASGFGDEKGEVRNDTRGIEETRALGRSLARFIRACQA